MNALSRCPDASAAIERSTYAPRLKKLSAVVRTLQQLLLGDAATAG